jgi:hypothetical protein
MTPSDQAYNQSRPCRVCEELIAKARYGLWVCSLKCVYELRTKTKQCALCGSDFKTRESKAKFCSRKCAAENRYGPSRHIKCKNCGVDFVFKCKVRDKKFCNSGCVREFEKTHRRPNYRGGRKADRGWTWGERQTQARERDEDMCVSLLHDPTYVPCRVEKCSVDHIVPYRVVMGWKQAGESVDPNHIDNLASMCRRCHQIKTTRIETRLMIGDVEGFVDGLRSCLPPEMIKRVLSLYGLLKSGREVIVAKEWKFDRRPSNKPREAIKTRGEKHWKSRLTEKQVREILLRRDEPRMVVAADYGVKPQYISQLICGIKWKWLQ